MELSKSKSAIRKYVRSLVKEMSAKEKQLESDELRRRALSHRLLPDASVVALFVSLPDEPETRPLIKELSLTHTVVLPVICGDEMEFYRYTPYEMHIGAYGIEEPSIQLQHVRPQDIDLMFSHINSTPRESLNGRTPYEVFSFFYGEELLGKLNVTKIDLDAVTLMPYLLNIK